MLQRCRLGKLPFDLDDQVPPLAIDFILYGTWNSDFSATGKDDDWRASLAAMANGALNLKPLISHRVLLADAIAALQMMKDGKEFYSKVLIQP